MQLMLRLDLHCLLYNWCTSDTVCRLMMLFLQTKETDRNKQWADSREISLRNVYAFMRTATASIIHVSHVKWPFFLLHFSFLFSSVAFYHSLSSSLLFFLSIRMHPWITTLQSVQCAFCAVLLLQTIGKLCAKTLYREMRSVKSTKERERKWIHSGVFAIGKRDVCLCVCADGLHRMLLGKYASSVSYALLLSQLLSLWFSSLCTTSCRFTGCLGEIATTHYHSTVFAAFAHMKNFSMWSAMWISLST